MDYCCEMSEGEEGEKAGCVYCERFLVPLRTCVCVRDTIMQERLSLSLLRQKNAMQESLSLERQISHPVCFVVGCCER